MVNNQSATINGGGAGGQRLVRAGGVTTKPSSQAFGNQPTRPTPDAVSSTWGATMGTSHWWNDMRNGSARLQACSANEPVKVARASGFVWREGCGNRVAPGEPPLKAVYESTSTGGGNSIVQNGPSYKLDINLPITIISAGNSGYDGYRPRYNNYRQQYRYCPPNYYQPRQQRRDCPPGYYIAR